MERGAAKFVETSRPASEGERVEMEKLGLLDKDGNPLPVPLPNAPKRAPHAVARRKISNLDVLNEAYDYEPVPSSFTRGMRVDLKSGSTFLWISGTSAVDEVGDSVWVGDIRAQTWRTLRNITGLLESEGASWQDIVRTTCYLRDIERDYKDFNEVRTHFLGAMGLDPIPASTGIQARICRSDLLIEIEAIAIIEEKR
jgi:enamine deaminase RidA (YjgF/YER057c/UK114 family)